MTTDDVFDAWEAAWSGRSTRAFAECCKDDLHYEDPLTPEPLESLRALEDHARRLWRAFPDARMERVGERMTAGAFAVAPARLTGTHHGPLGALPATHRRLVVDGVFYAELADGLLWRVRAFFDVYRAAVQLGALPRPGGVGERALLTLRGFGLRSRATGP